MSKEESVVGLFYEGLSRDKIAERLKISSKTVKKILDEKGLRKKTAKDFLEEKRDEIVNKYNSGIGSTTLCREYNCSNKAMVCFLNKYVEVKRKTPIVDNLRQNKQAVIDAYNAGESTYKIAKDYNTQDAMIYLFLRDECGVTMRPNFSKTIEEYGESVYKLFDEGHSVTSIAAKIDASPMTIFSWLRQSGRDTSRYSTQRAVPLNTHKDEIIEKYLGGKGCTVLSQEYDCSESAILDLISNEGLETGINQTSYSHNNSYFKEIDSWWKAYWLGWAVTDGTQSGNSFTLSITDKEIVEKFNECTENETPIRFIPRQKPHHKDQYAATISSVEMCKDLDKWGVIKNKTHHTFFPDIEEQYWAPFLLGCTEGDGSISLRQNKNGTYSGQWTFVGNEDLLYGIMERISRKLNISFNLHSPKHCSQNIKVIRIRFLEDTKKFLDYIYHDAPFYLKRKHDRYLKIAGS